MNRDENGENAGPRVFVIIPALNEEDAIGKVIDAIPNRIEWEAAEEMTMVEDVIVVDNGSQDATSDVAEDHGAIVLQEPRQGYGFACMTGIAHVKNLLENQDDQERTRETIIVFMDGDFSDHPEEMELLLEPIVKRGMDFVVGSRILGNREKGSMGLHAYLGNKIFGSILSVILREKVTDLGPFRAIRLSTLMVLGMCEGKYGWTVEMQMKAVKRGFHVSEVPVSYRKRVGSSKVSGNPWVSLKAFLYILYCIIKYSRKSTWS